MKLLQTLLAVSIIVSAALYKSLAYLNFKIHEQQVIAQLCEQRAEPENHCKGRCYLREVLGLEPKVPVEKMPDFSWEYEEVQLFLESTFFLNSRGDLPGGHFFRYAATVMEGVAQEFWHPPRKLSLFALTDT